MNYVMVYGTLKKGYLGNMMMEDSIFVDNGITALSYRMNTNGSYPMIVPSDDANSGKVVVEVYEVDDDTFEIMDEYECYPTLYTRNQHPVELSDGSVIDAWIYCYNGQLDYGRIVKPCVGIIEWEK